MPSIKAPDVFSGKARTSRRSRMSERAEDAGTSRTLLLSILAIIVFLVVMWTFLYLINRSMDPLDTLKSSTGSVFALLFAVIILDTINAQSEKKKKRREERKTIIRHNKIIQPVIDMYLVRKNMVITLNDKTVRKFQVNSTFTVKDMKDMYGPSELISDVGKSKIDVYAYYQDKLNDVLTHLVEDVDFNHYSELCDAAMEYINATSYGASALDAVRGYQNALAGMKSMKSVVINQIRDEPLNGKFIDAQPAMKNVYLLHQMINDQEKALGKYLKHVQEVIKDDEKESGKGDASEVDYE